MPPVEFEPTIPASARPQTYALDRAATGIGDGRTVKKLFLGNPDGKREAGRPKLKWLDCIENYLKLTDVKRWRKKAEGRSVSVIILKAALVKL
jgi:hypothetical protein